MTKKSGCPVGFKQKGKDCFKKVKSLAEVKKLIKQGYTNYVASGKKIELIIPYNKKDKYHINNTKHTEASFNANVKKLLKKMSCKTIPVQDSYYAKLKKQKTKKRNYGDSRKRHLQRALKGKA